MDSEGPKGILKHDAVPPFPTVFKVVAATLLLYLLTIFLASGANVVVGGHH
jgi:hypothetical protein